MHARNFARHLPKEQNNALDFKTNTFYSIGKNRFCLKLEGNSERGVQSKRRGVKRCESVADFSEVSPLMVI